MNAVQITRTCPARAVCTPGQIFRECRDTHVIVYLCTEFGVSSLKFHKLGGYQVYKVLTLLARAACAAQHR